MPKKHFAIAFCVLFSHHFLFSQCLVPPAPPGCTGSEPLVANNETINISTTKWYYGPATTYGDLTLNGGTLIVCGDLTVDRFYMDSGSVIIRPGGRFVIGSGIGAGMVLKGNSTIINYGTFEVQRNLSLDNGYATAAKPNRLINATLSSVFRMGNQYLVINNRDSWFINNGAMECWGIITDNQASAGSVCLGYSSTTRMAIMINKVADTYSVPVGSACVNVFQWSQFYGRLTSNPGLFACVGSGHSSDASCIPWGCQPNHWGNARVFAACGNCLAIQALPIEFLSVDGKRNANNGHDISWKTNGNEQPGVFRLERSADGSKYYTIDSISSNAAHVNGFTITDNNPLPGNNFYMIKFFNPFAGTAVSSRSVKMVAESNEDFTVYPVPFDQKFTIDYPTGMAPLKIIVTDITGRNIRIVQQRRQLHRQVEVTIAEDIPSDIYIVHIQTKERNISRTILKR